jgi:DNA-binding NarL/FixJ family response regulator
VKYRCACGTALPRLGRRCAECKQAQRRLTHKLWLDRQAVRGLCARCSNPNDGGSLCPRHRELARAADPPNGRPIGRSRQSRCDVYVDLLRAGQSVREIARALGRHRSTVVAALRRRGAIAGGGRGA